MSTQSPYSEQDAIPVLVLSPRYTSDSRVLRKAALDIGWHVERLGGWSVPERLRRRKLVFSGEPTFMKVIAHKLSWALLDAPIDWLLSLPSLYRKRSIALMTLAQARELSSPTFVKPAADKSFPSAVYASGALLAQASDTLPDSTLVLVAEPVHWEIEFRFFLLERRIITFSSYWRVDRLTQLDDGTWEASEVEMREAQDWMNTLLADWSVKIPPAIVIDIGKLRDRGWAVIEANAAWAAGIYGCDPVQILPVLERACVHRNHLSADDALWESNRDAKRPQR